MQLFWLPSLRASAPTLLVVGLLVSAGLWADHFMVIVVTLQHDFLPSSDASYSMNIWGVATFIGSIGLFSFLLLLFLRYFPVVSIMESRRLATARDWSDVASGPRYRAPSRGVHADG